MKASGWSIFSKFNFVVYHLLFFFPHSDRVSNEPLGKQCFRYDGFKHIELITPMASWLSCPLQALLPLYFFKDPALASVCNHFTYKMPVIYLYGQLWSYF